MVAQLDDLCYLHLDFCFDLLYFPIQITEKYSIVLCYHYPGHIGQLTVYTKKRRLRNSGKREENLKALWEISEKLQIGWIAEQGERYLGEGSSNWLTGTWEEAFQALLRYKT